MVVTAEYTIPVNVINDMKNKDVFLERVRNELTYGLSKEIMNKIDLPTPTIKNGICKWAVSINIERKTQR